MRIVFAWTVLLAGAAYAQTSPVIGINNFIHATEDWEKSVAFYQDVFGLPKPNPPRPPNPAVPALINAPGAQLRVAVFRLPGAAFGWELTHFGPIETKRGQAKPTDPGAAHLTLHVRDLAPILAAVKKVGAPIVSRGGVAVETIGSRSVMMRDPDGFLVEVREVTPVGDAPASNLIGATMGLTVSNLESTVKFYRGLLGLEPTRNEYVAGKAALDLIDAPANTSYGQTSLLVPNTKARMEFTAFQDVAGTRFHLRVPDPGCPAVAFRVADLDGLLKRLKAAGVKVVSAGGEPAQFSPTIRNIFVEDPDGFKVELYQSGQ